MRISLMIFRPTAVALGIILAGCAGTPPAHYAGIDSTSQLQPNTGQESDRIPFRYSTQVDWKKYTCVIIDPVVIYQGVDNQFAELSVEDRRTLATYMQNQFT